MARRPAGSIEDHVIDDEEFLNRSVQVPQIHSNLNPAEKPNLEALKGLIPGIEGDPISEQQQNEQEASDKAVTEKVKNGASQPNQPPPPAPPAPIQPVPASVGAPPLGVCPPGMSHPYVPPQQLSPPASAPPKEIIFENDGVRFKIVDNVVYKEDWVEADVTRFRVTKKAGKSIKILPSDEIMIEKKDWVKLENDD